MGYSEKIWLQTFSPNKTEKYELGNEAQRM